jgi:hypothetical protein
MKHEIAVLCALMAPAAYAQDASFKACADALQQTAPFESADMPAALLPPLTQQDKKDGFFNPESDWQAQDAAPFYQAYAIGLHMPGAQLYISESDDAPYEDAKGHAYRLTRGNAGAWFRIYAVDSVPPQLLLTGMAQRVGILPSANEGYHDICISAYASAGAQFVGLYHFMGTGYAPFKCWSVDYGEEAVPADCMLKTPMARVAKKAVIP